MPTKTTPHHPLADLQAKFSSVAALVITWSATQDASALGYTLQDIVNVIQKLKPRFREIADRSQPNLNVWHDTYKAPFDGMILYLKFAGAALIDVKLVSFKEA